MEQVDLVLDCKNEHGEGIFWSASEQKLYWTDIEGYKVWRYDPETQQAEHFDVDERLCAFALRQDGTILAAFASCLAIYNLETKERKNLSLFEEDKPTTRLNDGRVDRQGRFVVGGMDESGDGHSISSVIRVNTDFSTQLLIDNVACANSACFSPDGKTMYFTDTPTQELCSYRYGNEGVSDRVVIHSCEDRPGVPDGSTIDADGFLWNAEWNGSCVTRYSPTGELDAVVDVPVRNPTCVALGGKNMDTLFVTTSRQMMDEKMLSDSPTAGGLFAIKVTVPGVNEPEFNG